MKKTVIFLVGLIFSAFELNAFAQIDAEIKIDNDNSVVHADVALKPGQRGGKHNKNRNNSCRTHLYIKREICENSFS